MKRAEAFVWTCGVSGLKIHLFAMALWPLPLTEQSVLLVNGVFRVNV